MSDAVERICPSCRAAQQLSAHYCATCGAPLERMLPVRSAQWLPAVIRQRMHHPIVRGVAMGMAAVAVEVVIRLVQRAMTRGVSSALVPRHNDSAVQHPASARRTTIKGRRRTWFWRDYRGNDRSEEQIEWQRIDE